MNRHGRFIIITMLLALLSGCISGVWTGASLIYDRHNVYQKLSDYHLGSKVNRALFHDKTFKLPSSAIDVAVFNGDVLLAGHVPVASLRHEAQSRVEQVGGYRRFFNLLSLEVHAPQPVSDSWITAKIRSQIIADSEINPHAFKIVTSDAVVYVMGDVRPEQAKKVIHIARHTAGVKKVVRLLRYYSYQEKLVA